MTKVAIVGGVSYLGANLLYYHAKKGHEVHIITRERSLARRPTIAKWAEMLANEIHVYTSLYSSHVFRDLMHIKPELSYIVLGKLYGDWASVYTSNTHLPLKIIKYIEYVFPSSINVFISQAFSPYDLDKSVIELDSDIVFTVYTDKSIRWDTRPKPLFNKGYFISKHIAERFINTYFRNSYVLRAGLLIGMFPTHIEWRILELASSANIAVPLLNRIPITVSIDVARIAEFILERPEALNSRTFVATRYSPTIKDLIAEYRRIKNKIMGRFEDSGIKSIGINIPAPLLDYNEYIYPYNLNVCGFKEWSRPELGFEMAIKTISYISIL